MHRVATRILLVSAIFLAACRGAGMDPDDAGSADAAPEDGGLTLSDATADAGQDAGARDAGRDAGHDAGHDGGPRCNFYRDADGDGFGDPSLMMEASCSLVPEGYVANADDCYDDNADANPGQTAWSGTERGDGSFDWNCDSNEELQWPEPGLCPDTSIVPPAPGTVGWDPALAVPACGISGHRKNLEAQCGWPLFVQQRCR